MRGTRALAPPAGPVTAPEQLVAISNYNLKNGHFNGVLFRVEVSVCECLIFTLTTFHLLSALH